jgi:hypothetical protein
MNHLDVAIATGGLSDGQRLSLAVAIAEATGGDHEPLLSWTDKKLVKKAKELVLCDR